MASAVLEKYAHYSGRSNPVEEIGFLEVFVNLIQWKPDLISYHFIRIMMVLYNQKWYPMHQKAAAESIVNCFIHEAEIDYFVKSFACTNFHETSPNPGFRNFHGLNFCGQ